MSIFQVWRFWSPMTGGMAARVSMPGPDGREYWMQINHVEGRAYREARDRAVEAIETAIEAKLVPGEVRIR